MKTKHYYIFGWLFASFLSIGMSHAETYNKLECVYFDKDYYEKYSKPIVSCILNSKNMVEVCDMHLNSFSMDKGGFPIIKVYGKVVRPHHNRKNNVIMGEWTLKKYDPSEDVDYYDHPELYKEAQAYYKYVWTFDTSWHRKLQLHCDLTPTKRKTGEPDIGYNDLLPEHDGSEHTAGSNDDIFATCPFDDKTLCIDNSSSSSSSSSSGPLVHH